MNDPRPIPESDMRAVYLGQLRVENIGCFSRAQTLNLTNDDGHPARWTLVLGDNGVGKTTLMQVAACFSPGPRSPADAEGGRKWINQLRLPPMARQPNCVARVGAKLFICDPLSQGGDIATAEIIGFDVSRHERGHVIAGLESVPNQLEALTCFAASATWTAPPCWTCCSTRATPSSPTASARTWPIGSGSAPAASPI